MSPGCKRPVLEKEKKGGYSVRGQEHGTITESIILKQLNESSLNETQNFYFDENINSTSATHANTGIHDDFQNRDILNEKFSTNATHTSTGSHDDFQNHDGLHEVNMMYVKWTIRSDMARSFHNGVIQMAPVTLKV